MPIQGTSGPRCARQSSTNILSEHAHFLNLPVSPLTKTPRTSPPAGWGWGRGEGCLPEQNPAGVLLPPLGTARRHPRHHILCPLSPSTTGYLAVAAAGMHRGAQARAGTGQVAAVVGGRCCWGGKVDTDGRGRAVKDRGRGGKVFHSFWSKSELGSGWPLNFFRQGFVFWFCMPHYTVHRAVYSIV